MSLLVNVYKRLPGGGIELVEPEHHHQELAGFESYRRRLYGSSAARSLGLQLLPTLEHCDIYAEGADVDRLRAEAELALTNIELFEAETGTTGENLRPRFENIIDAARKAVAISGGVVIW
jgi:hypothetical protein